MDNKVRIGTQSDEVRRATDAEQFAQKATSDLTMMQRRVRTFYTAVSEVVFPEAAPSWAPDWVEWLLTGDVAPVEAVAEEAVTPAEEAAVEAAATPEEAAVEAVFVLDTNPEVVDPT